MNYKIEFFNSDYVHNKKCMGIILEDKITKGLSCYLTSEKNYRFPPYQILDCDESKNFNEKYNFIIHSTTEQYPEQLIKDIKEKLDSIEDNN